MMFMINANFAKQENQNPPAADPPEKDPKADDFSALISGLCMTPQGSSPVAGIPVSEKPAEEIDTQFPGGGDQSDKNNGATTDIKTSILAQMPDPVEPDLKTARSAQPTGMELPPAQEVGAPIRQQHLRSVSDRTDTKFAPPRGCFDLPPAPVEPVKLLVKDLKTQADKFAEIPAASEPIKTAKNFAAMTKDKADVVKALAAAGAQIHIDPPGGLTNGDDAADPDVTHFDHNYVDPIKIAEFVRDRTQRKLPKLISEVTEIATEENASVLPSESAAKTDAPVLPKMSAMLEQIKPAVIQLAAAAANDGSGEGKQILKMRLHPAELGTVEIRLEKNDDGVLKAHFKTDNDATKNFLTQGLGRLREALQNAGWQIGRVEISSSLFSPNNGSNGGDSPAQKDARPGYETSANDSDAKGFGPGATRSDDRENFAGDRLVSLRA